MALIQISLGGMVAEEMFFGESGTGPGGDLVSATNVAVEMVGSLGLGGSLISYRAVDAGAIGGNLTAKVLSDKSGRDAVEALLAENKTAVARLMSENRHLVEALRDALLEHHELIDNEIIAVIDEAERIHAEFGADTRVVDLRSEPPAVQQVAEPTEAGVAPRLSS